VLSRRHPAAATWLTPVAQRSRPALPRRQPL